MINYPSGSRSFHSKYKKNNINYSSRGMSLEDRINESNLYYLNKNLAIIHKKPTPIQVVKVNYPKRSSAKITEAYYRKPSTTDYNGIYQGKYIDFEAKETQNLTNFPLANLPKHQSDHMKKCIEHGGISFLIISFKKKSEIYLLPFERVLSFIEKNQQKNLPYSFIAEAGYQCPQGIFPYVDYLQALDQYLLDK